MNSAKFIFVLSCIVIGCRTQYDSSYMKVLYEPFDITKDCRSSTALKFHLSHGMGLSDTISLVIRTRSPSDFECFVKVFGVPGTYMILVIQYPASLNSSCASDPEAIYIGKKTKLNKPLLIPICETINRQRSDYRFYRTYFSGSLIVLKFQHNYLTNFMHMVDYYMITVTTAMKKYTPKTKQKSSFAKNVDRICRKMNESLCEIGDHYFCYTNGVDCDGIKNCGVPNWHDELKTKCTSPKRNITATSVVTACLIIIMALLAIIHSVFRCLPAMANRFFIFNENEDNRLYVLTTRKRRSSDNFFISMKEFNESNLTEELESSTSLPESPSLKVFRSQFSMLEEFTVDDSEAQFGQDERTLSKKSKPTSAIHEELVKIAIERNPSKVHKTSLRLTDDLDVTSEETGRKSFMSRLRSNASISHLFGKHTHK